MVVAFTSENGLVFGHFGRTPELTYYEVKDGKIINKVIESTSGHGHGEIVQMLIDHHVNVLVCGGLGQGAVTYLGNAGIEIYAGNSGSCDMLIEKFVDGLLDPNKESSCDHHHEDGEEHCKAGGCGDSGCCH